MSACSARQGNTGPFAGNYENAKGDEMGNGGFGKVYDLNLVRENPQTDQPYKFRLYVKEGDGYKKFVYQGETPAEGSGGDLPQTTQDIGKLVTREDEPSFIVKVSEEGGSPLPLKEGVLKKLLNAHDDLKKCIVYSATLISSSDKHTYEVMEKLVPLKTALNSAQDRTARVTLITEFSKWCTNTINILAKNNLVMSDFKVENVLCFMQNGQETQFRLCDLDGIALLPGVLEKYYPSKQYEMSPKSYVQFYPDFSKNLKEISADGIIPEYTISEFVKVAVKTHLLLGFIKGAFSGNWLEFKEIDVIGAMMRGLGFAIDEYPKEVTKDGCIEWAKMSIAKELTRILNVRRLKPNVTDATVENVFQPIDNFGGGINVFRIKYNQQSKKVGDATVKP
ncbi:MAG: hypothetical protein CMF52_05850 [Legionellales bacterium]|nr:hypothetical protein [Legionellales bacterium]